MVVRPHETSPGQVRNGPLERISVDVRLYTREASTGPLPGWPSTATLSAWSPHSPTASPHHCNPWPSLFLLHSDQISPQGSSVVGRGAPPARVLCRPRPWGGDSQEDCIRPVRRLPASDFPCRESRHRARTGVQTHRQRQRAKQVN